MICAACEGSGFDPTFPRMYRVPCAWCSIDPRCGLRSDGTPRHVREIVQVPHVPCRVDYASAAARGVILVGPGTDRDRAVRCPVAAGYEPWAPGVCDACALCWDPHVEPYDLAGDLPVRS